MLNECIKLYTNILWRYVVDQIFNLNFIARLILVQRKNEDRDAIDKRPLVTFGTRHIIVIHEYSSKHHHVKNV